MNADLAEYHVPVNADVGSIDIAFVEEIDAHVNPIGVKGVGEIPIVGVAGVHRERGVPRYRKAGA